MNGRYHQDDMSLDELSASPQLRRSVQDRVRQLREGSPSRRTLTVSTPDLSDAVSLLSHIHHHT